MRLMGLYVFRINIFQKWLWPAMYGNQQLGVKEHRNFGADFLNGVIFLAYWPKVLAHQQKISYFPFFPFGQVIRL